MTFEQLKKKLIARHYDSRALEAATIAYAAGICQAEKMLIKYANKISQTICSTDKETEKLAEQARKYLAKRKVKQGDFE